MAIALSIAVSLIVGVTVMFNTKYFWDKEDNPNICAMNTSMTEFTNVTGTVGSIGIIILVVIILGAAVCLCSCRGF